MPPIERHLRCRPAGRRLLLAAPFAALAGASAPAWAQTLPALGAPGFSDNLRGQLEQYFPNALPRQQGPAFTVVPSIGVSLAATDNADYTNNGRGGADVYAIINPALLIAGDSSRFRVNLNYAPTAYVYFTQTDQTRVANTLSGSARAIIVPDSVFLDVAGQISQQSRFGGFGQNNAVTLNRQEEVQSSSFSISPNAERRFGGWGTGRVSYTLTRTIQDGYDNANGSPYVSNGFGQLTPAYGSTGNLTTHAERAVFSTGENLGRVNDTVSLDGLQYSGSPAYRGAHRYTVLNEVQYALTRSIALQGGFGYQDLAFPTLQIKQGIWNAGVRLDPNPDSTITIQYGRRDGATDLSFDGTYTPTARTRVFARYTNGISSGLEDQQALLQSTTVGATGLLTDARTGAPVAYNGAFYGTQNSLYRVRRLSVGGLLMFDRDSFSANVSNEDRTTLTDTTNFSGTVIVPAGTTTTGTYGSLSWQHDIAPDLNSVASVQYGVYNNGALLGLGNGQSQRTISAVASLNRQFSATLSGSVTYLFTDRSGGQGSVFYTGQATSSTTQNTLIVGLRKSF